MSIKVTQENYSSYKKVYEIFCQHLFNYDKLNQQADIGPIAVLNDWETKSKSLAKRALQSGLNDCLSTLNYYPKETVADINLELKKNELPNINELCGLIQKTMKQVLKSGKIKNVDQYYIVKEILDDTASGISHEERNRLSDSLGKFEQAIRR